MPAAAATPDPQSRPPSVAIVGAGPRGTSLLERIAANHPEIRGDRPLDVHVVDPHPPGGGRIWRWEQSRLLWMNTTADDCTMFTDDSVAVAGPVRPGPTLTEWARDLAAGRITIPPGFVPQAETIAEAARVHGGWFATRRLQSQYLSWVFWTTVAGAARTIRVRVHEATATDLRDLPDGRQRLVLDGGRAPLDVDVVVLAQGTVDARPGPEEEALLRHAADHGLAYLPTGPTADLSFAELRPGEPVIVRGLGLAFIDAMVLLTSGRGGTFRRDRTGTLHYSPSGREPVLYAGSRRGVPYHSKIHYDFPRGTRPRLPRHFSPSAVAALGERPLDFDTDLRPLIVRELTDAAYRELAEAHPERLSLDPAVFLDRLDRLDWDGPDLKELVSTAVPEEADRVDLDRLDRPLAQRRFASTGDLQEWMRGYVAADLARRRDPRHSADLAVFHALLSVFTVLGELLADDRVSARSRERGLPGFLGFFSYYASGPPGPRLEELLALSRAGIVRFLGADVQVSATPTGFAARSSSVAGEVTARALVDARLAAGSLSRASDPLLRRLAARGEVAELVRVDAEAGTRHPTGLVDADLGDQRLRRAGGDVHSRRFGAGALVSGGVGAGGFSRPRTNAGFFRQNDTVARRVLAELDRLPGGTGPAGGATAAADHGGSAA
ncbi:FAD/NAD(P)-binding protein [Marinitenerispora sediminis]|uniref:Adenylate cyclase n=1 Tax=Marinitenerispora sediminis TaxID=1931232 RepID=A0A368SYE9_9ACTN|nr:FAD/NAD(P)-binding protein [Marinitenerispora sediminis]RCV47593.1 adenylate cyclase [Marinitenerispora sediminis]RCV47884.1 adenylate cyclase [Marinitenerispora sediminis]RCV49241.1 adenylate cyclase [Marinitenerispora sediminis]